MDKFLREVIEETSKDTGVDIVFDYRVGTYIINLLGESKVVDPLTQTVQPLEIQDILCLGENIVLMHIDDKFKSILGLKLYNLDDAREIITLLKLWVEFELELYAYSVEYDIDLVNSMIDYFTLKIRETIQAKKIVSYKNVFKTFLSMDKEMAVAYCHGFMEKYNNSNTPDAANSIEELLAKEKFSDNFINYMYSIDKNVYILFEEEKDSLVLDTETNRYRGFTEDDIRYTEKKRGKIVEIDVPDNRCSVVNSVIHNISTNTVDKVCMALIVQLFELDESFSSVRYEEEKCKNTILFIDYLLNNTSSSSLVDKQADLLNNKTFKEFIRHKGNACSVAYVNGYWQAIQDTSNN